GELKRINGSGRFGPNPCLSKEDAERKIDKDLFNTARLEDIMTQEPEYRTFEGLNSFVAPSSTNLPCQLNYQCAAVP
ncbi:hypothetical protein FOC4_h10016913, partial [Fusarium odoratissimum]